MHTHYTKQPTAIVASQNLIGYIRVSVKRNYEEQRKELKHRYKEAQAALEQYLTHKAYDREEQVPDVMEQALVEYRDRQAEALQRLDQDNNAALALLKEIEENSMLAAQAQAQAQPGGPTPRNWTDSATRGYRGPEITLKGGPITPEALKEAKAAALAQFDAQARNKKDEQTLADIISQAEAEYQAPGPDLLSKAQTWAARMETAAAEVMKAPCDCHIHHAGRVVYGVPGPDCVAERHYWIKDAQPPDMCNCGKLYSEFPAADCSDPARHDC